MIIVLNGWFVKRRGFAYGVVFASADVFGLIYGFMVCELLRKNGIMVTFLSLAAIVIAIPGPCIWLFKRRLPQTTADDKESATTLQQDSTKHSYARRPIFYLMMIANLLHAVSFQIPFIYISSAVTDMGFEFHYGTIALSVANVAQIAGEVAYGELSDHFNVGTLMGTALLGTSLSAFLLWGLARNYAQMIAFAALYGIFGSGLLALWARISTLFGDGDSSAKVYSYLSLIRGAAGIASSPISTWLLSKSTRSDFDFFPGQSILSNGKYAPLVLFVGACMAGAACLGACAVITDKSGRASKAVDDEAK